MITLYGSASPNVLKVAIALQELNLNYTWTHVNVWSGEQFAPAIRSLNPLSKVPILVEDETVVFESGAILLYLAEKAPGVIIPADAAARLEALQWLFVQCANIGPMCGQLIHFETFAQQLSDYALRRYRGQVRKLYDVLEQRLSGRPYLAGETYSVADIATFPWIRIHDLYGQTLSPALSAWVSRMLDRPAVDRAVQRHLADIRPADYAMRAAATPAELDLLFPGRIQG